MDGRHDERSDLQRRNAASAMGKQACEAQRSGECNDGGK